MATPDEKDEILDPLQLTPTENDEEQTDPIASSGRETVAIPDKHK